MLDDEHSRLRKAAHEIYTTDIQPPQRRSVLHEEKVVSSDDWKSPVQPPDSFQPMKPIIKTTSWFRNIFIASLLFLVVAVVVLGVSFYNGGNSISEDNVEIAVTTKTYADGGESLPVDVTIINKNKVPLELATLVLEYPEGSGDASGTGTVARISHDIGTIGAGATDQETFTVQLYGTQNSQKTITAHMEFNVEGSNAVYDKDEPALVTIRTSPVTITLDAPDKAIPNQDIPLKFSIVGNGTATLPNTAMILQYPSGFTFSKADPAPSSGTNVWYLGDLPPGVNRTITVTGSLSGSVTDLKTITASVGAQDSGNEQTLDTTYNSLAQVIPLSNAFLDASITSTNGVATGNTIPIASNEDVHVTIPWSNTLSVPITNAQITVNLSGSAYDPTLVEPVNGFFNTTDNSIVWSSQQDPDLALIAPGASGQVTFAFKPLQLSSSNATTNPVVNASLDVVGYQSDGTKLTASDVASETFAMNSDLNLLVSTVHYTGSIQNTGPMPPVPNKETTYTLQWKIANLRNHVSGAVVTTTLPTYVAWKNVVAPQSEAANVTYNAVTRQLVWNAGDLPSGSGIAPKTLSVQVGITPSTQQTGATPDLTTPIVLTGHDTFTNQDLTITKLPLNTQLLNDGNGPGTYGQVGQ